MPMRCRRGWCRAEPPRTLRHPPALPVPPRPPRTKARLHLLCPGESRGARTLPVVAPSEPRPTASLAPEPSRGDPMAELSAGPVSAAALLHPQRQRELIEQAAGAPRLIVPAAPAGGARQAGPSGAPEAAAAPQFTSGGATDGCDAAPVPPATPPAPKFTRGGQADGADAAPVSPGAPPAPELAGGVPPARGAGGTPGELAARCALLQAVVDPGHANSAASGVRTRFPVAIVDDHEPLNFRMRLQVLLDFSGSVVRGPRRSRSSYRSRSDAARANETMPGADVWS